MKTEIKILIILCTVFTGCDLNLEDVEKNCNNLSIEELRKQNTISEECKKSIQDLLPKPQSYLGDKLLKTGIKLSSTYDTVYFSLSDKNGNTEPLDTSKIKIVSWSEGLERDITKNIAWVKGNLNYSLGVVVDYSASMSADDINDAYYILNLFLNIITFLNNSEANHIIFSTSVTEKSQYVSGSKMLKTLLTKDTSYLRESTSLYDAIGFGLESLSIRTRPAKILIVFTDGEENSSKKFNVDKIINLANDNNITIILVGSLFSDIDAFELISNGTKGIYLYNSKIKDLETNLTKAGQILTEFNSFVIDNSLAGDSIVLTYKERSITYKIK
jgi:hypothetical protein